LIPLAEKSMEKAFETTIKSDEVCGGKAAAHATPSPSPFWHSLSRNRQSPERTELIRSD
jgi:hypothetical protein